MNTTLKYISTLVLGSLLLTACKKQIDQSPSHTLDGDERFETIEDYDFALTGVYTRLLQNSYFGSTGLPFLPEILSDNASETTESLANYTTLSTWNYTSDDVNVEDVWLDGYLVIQQANLTLRGIDELASTNQGAVNRIKGQALALRANTHFDLMRYFGEDHGRNSVKLGVPYVEVFDLEQKPARLTVKATYDKIEQDLKMAKDLMRNMDKSIQSITNITSAGRPLVDSLVVDAMLARMYNYAGVDDSAIKYATYVINARPLADTTEFRQIWKDGTTKEVVWSVKFQAFNGGLGTNLYYAIGNRSTYRPTTNLLNLYNSTNDVRYSSYFQIRARGASSRFVYAKYIGREGRTDDIVDFKAFRTAEMYLIRAEAYARKGNDLLALADLNTLRLARNAAVGAETGAALMTAIFTERRKELVAEGHRWFDLKRTTRTVVRTTNCSNFCNLPASAREWNFPIPQSEIDANPNIQQNPGY
ncbi:MAG: RagB/SusD family nutrient uptake outer membrane protein [Flavisolibacter sp.]